MLTRIFRGALRIAICSCLSSFVTVYADPITVKDVEDALSNLDGNTLNEVMIEFQVPGVSIAIFDNYEVVYAQGFGVRDEDSGEPVDTETIFQAASISKPVAATVMLSMVEDGLLDLDEPVNTFLTSWKVPEHEWEEVQQPTLRLIVAHQAGFTVHGFGGYSYRSEPPSAVGVLIGERPDANSPPVIVDVEPGTLYRYSGGGYTVMQVAMVDVAGEKFQDIAHERVLAPAGMTRSAFAQPPTGAYAENAASAHNSRGKAIRGKWHTYPEYAAAGLWTTPTDLAKFAIMYQRALNEEEGLLLSPELTAEALQPVGDGGHGLGFSVEEDAFGHGGSNRGFRCQLGAAKEGGSGYVIMTNGDKGGEVISEIWRGINHLMEEGANGE